VEILGTEVNPLSSESGRGRGSYTITGLIKEKDQRERGGRRESRA